jgi:rubredoxin
MEKAMAVWKCNNCGNTIEVQAPPEKCPSCKQNCEFVDVSCYVPDCGGAGSGNVDEQVFTESFKGSK